VIHVSQTARFGEFSNAVGGGDAADAAGVDLEVLHAVPPSIRLPR